MSSQRGNAQTPYNAKRYTFTLGVDAEVTIDLSSSLDTYLYLLEGHGTEGDVRAYNDDAGSRTLDSRLKLDLKAGEYTIEATTLIYRKEGSFTLKVATDIVGSVPVKVTRLAERYDATVDELFSAGFTYEPDEAQMSVESVEPSGLRLTWVDRSGRVGLAGKPKLAGSYTVTLTFAQPGRTDTVQFIVDASCAADHFQKGDRSCEPCTTSLRTPGSGTLGVRTGSWYEDCLLPAGRRSGSDKYYARHFTFTLSEDAEVTIDLESDDQDTYMFLLDGHGPDGTVVTEDDDGGVGNRGRNSRLTNLALDAGKYTVTASTHDPTRIGSFSLAVLGVIGLQKSHRATVGDVFSTGFRYRPRDAVLKILPVTPSGLSLTRVPRNGSVGVAGTPTRADTYTVTLEFSQGTQTHTRTFTIKATCPARRVQVKNHCVAPVSSSLRSSYGVTRPSQLAVEFHFKPAAAVPSLSSVSSGGLAVSVDHDPAKPGKAVLKAMPNRAGSWIVEIELMLSGVKLTPLIQTRIWAECPAGQKNLSGNCVTPLESIRVYRENAEVVPRPENTDKCYRTKLPDDSSLYTCRKIVRRQSILPKTDPRILGTSEHDDTYGTLLALKDDRVLEGCQTLAVGYWQCDFVGENVAYRRPSKSISDLFFRAFDEGVRKPAQCAAALIRLAVTKDAASAAAAAAACGSLFSWEAG